MQQEGQSRGATGDAGARQASKFHLISPPRQWGADPVPPTEMRFTPRKIDLSTTRDSSKGISRLFLKKK